MRARIEWALEASEAVRELPAAEQDEIFEKLDLLIYFPRMYRVQTGKRFRRYRRFVAGNWIVFYRVEGQTVYVRGIWPARMP